MKNWNHDSHDSNGPQENWAGDHQLFVELCALSTSGPLPEAEASELRVHLLECEECREAMAEFRFVAVEGASTLVSADADTIGENASEQHPWRLEDARRVFLARIAAEDSTGRKPISPSRSRSSAPSPTGILATLTWQQRLQYVATSIAVLGLCTVGGYRLGKTPVQGRVPAVQETDMQTQLLSERSALEEQLKSRSASIGELSRELKDRTGTIQELKRQLADVQSLDRNHQSEMTSALAQNAAITDERDSLLSKLKDTETSRDSLQTELAALQTERRDDLLRISSLEMRIDQLNGRLRETQETVAQQQDFLGSDRDIRDLMGARNLYITDVVDVDKNGRTKKPFGRIFYTKGKSLIFYAFDLDQHRGLQNAAFQLWGQRGSDRNSSLNMGIFYLDNEANRRWVLKFDDPEKLAQINAVFVTIEPSGGSQKPAGKQLLYASLRTLPNHP
jgi:hypothetical protein